MGRKVLKMDIKSFLQYHSWLKPIAYGLSITDNSIKMAKIDKHFKLIKLAKVKKGKNQLKDLQNIIKQIGAKPGDLVNISIPEKFSFIYLINKSSEKIDIKQKIEENVPLPIDKIYHQEKEHGDGILITAVVKKIVNDYLSLLNQVGLIAQSVEPESLSMVRALAPKSGIVLIIELGSSRVNFIIASRELIYFTAYRSHYPESPINITNISQQIFEYSSFLNNRYKKSLVQIILCGSQAKKNLANIISVETKIPSKQAENPDFTVAIGLAMKTCCI